VRSVLTGLLFVTAGAHAANCTLTSVVPENYRALDAHECETGTFEQDGERLKAPRFCLLRVTNARGESGLHLFDAANNIFAARGGFYSPEDINVVSRGHNMNFGTRNRPATLHYAVEHSRLEGAVEYSHKPIFGSERVIARANFRCR
jgi:hypothetical protein